MVDQGTETIYIPATGELQRWNLETLKSEATGKLALTEPSAFGMGSASAGPLLVIEKGASHFVDLESLTSYRADALDPQASGRDHKCWISADGRTIGYKLVDCAHSKFYEVVNITEDKRQRALLRSGATYVVPGWEGTIHLIPQARLLIIVPESRDKAAASRGSSNRG